MKPEKILDITKEQVEKLKDLLGVDATVECSLSNGEDGFVVVNVVFKGEDLGYMIGNRGLHLQALQYILSNIVRGIVRKEDEEAKLAIMVDVGGYREQRNEKIERLAMQKADDARILGEPVDLLPMSASDRRVVHAVLGKFDDIKTESFGDGFDRYVRITPVSEKDLGVAVEEKTSEMSEE